ncbi:hypothetical protein [Rhodococcus phenolicus]|uniref:hypothetical protein n=1 Tax=Rhodococcus phenolicus TaxID=263849 RepID=UPI000B10FE74|nr:hypothetical protein [Rhodococcus phenolicus]
MSIPLDQSISQALEEVLRVQETADAIPLGHSVPKCDLAVDEDRFPDIWATTVVRRGLNHAVECIEAACALVLNGEWTNPQFALLRAAYESAGAATWLLAPDDVDTRLARLIWQHRDSWHYAEKAYSGTPLEVEEQVERQQWATDAAAKLRINLRNGDPGGFQKLISSIDDLPQHPQSLLTAWRLCSGVSHAKTWALREITTEVRSTQLYEHGHLIQVKPNRELFLTQLQVARRMVQRVGALYRIRTTPRPHGLSMRLVPRDNEGNEVHGKDA